MSEPLRVFLNGKALSVPPGSTVLDAVQAADPVAAAEIRAGSRLVADSRGITVAAETPLTGGFVMRLIAARARSAATDAD